MKIVFASHNAGKIEELTSLMAPFHFTIVPQSEWGIQEIPETGKTFIENALLKARFICEKTHLPSLADDSGLLVDALQGAPGIYSARYAGDGATSEDNINKLLAEIKDVPEERRTCAFYCVIVLLMHPDDPAPLICEGTWHGTLLEQPRGHHGFGYDPIFWDDRENCSAAELTLAQKNQISHRGKALKSLLEKLNASAFHKRP